MTYKEIGVCRNCGVFKLKSTRAVVIQGIRRKYRSHLYHCCCHVPINVLPDKIIQKIKSQIAQRESEAA